MTGITLLLAAAAAGFALSKWLRVPAIPVLILMGFVATLPGLIDEDLLVDALVLGLTVLVFVAGIELNPGRVGRHKKAALQVGLLQFVALGGAGVGLTLLLGFDVQAAVYLGLALTASSTLVVVRLLQQRGQLFEPVGRLVIGVLLLQDFLVILSIPVLTRLPDGGEAVAFGLLATLALMGLSWIFLRWVGPWTIERVSFDEETLLLVVLGVLFLFLGLSELFQLPLVAGAFFAGVALSSFPVSSLVRGQLKSLSDFFSALFFTALGGFLVVPDPAVVLQAVALAVAVLVITPPLVALVTERAGFTARSALLGGLLLSQTSEFSLVVGLQGVALGHLGPEVFTLIVLTTLFTMILTPVVATDRVTWALMRIHPFRARRTGAERPRDHVLLVGCGSGGVSLLETLIVGPYPVVVVDEDPALVEHLQESGVDAIRGDASDVEVLREAGADQARVVVSMLRRAQDNAPLLAYAREVPVFVRAFNVADAHWIEGRKGRPILFSEAAADEFLRWMEATDGGRHPVSEEELPDLLEGSDAPAPSPGTDASH